MHLIQKLEKTMLVKTYGSAIMGVEAMTVTVEVTTSPGAGFSIVGLPTML